MRARIIKVTDSDIARKLIEVRGISSKEAWKKVKEFNFNSEMNYIRLQFKTKKNNKAIC